RIGIAVIPFDCGGPQAVFICVEEYFCLPAKFIAGRRIRNQLFYIFPYQVVYIKVHSCNSISDLLFGVWGRVSIFIFTQLHFATLNSAFALLRRVPTAIISL